MNKLMILCTIFALIFGASENFADAVKFGDCGSKSGKLASIRVSDCDVSSKVCLLKRFTNATIELDFELVEDVVVENVTTVVHGILLETEIPFPLENSNACLNGISCPLAKGQTHKYVQSLPVKIYYPPVRVTIKFELKDVQTNKTIICVLIPARITLL
ncbi:NPC intracellular cholesterol transporter 2 homolog a-like [Sitodiplosis mosellana]|uniref:NPC intracellular cholesterol transporter 2 homolog a-like n=1 Tax=Sitodiplosis mosellana TaxID=263140 RepID=UPI002444B40F|nr:NPC intracellular cholesterol transporter 2 homolog a-like [Sitodiplosis mosellana]